MDLKEIFAAQHQQFIDKYDFNNNDEMIDVQLCYKVQHHNGGGDPTTHWHGVVLYSRLDALDEEMKDNMFIGYDKQLILDTDDTIIPVTDIENTTPIFAPKDNYES